MKSSFRAGIARRFFRRAGGLPFGGSATLLSSADGGKVFSKKIRRRKLGGARRCDDEQDGVGKTGSVEKLFADKPLIDGIQVSDVYRYGKWKWRSSQLGFPLAETWSGLSE